MQKKLVLFGRAPQDLIETRPTDLPTNKVFGCEAVILFERMWKPSAPPLSQLDFVCCGIKLVVFGFNECRKRYWCCWWLVFEWESSFSQRWWHHCDLWKCARTVTIESFCVMRFFDMIVLSLVESSKRPMNLHNSFEFQELYWVLELFIVIFKY